MGTLTVSYRLIGDIRMFTFPDGMVINFEPASTGEDIGKILTALDVDHIDVKHGDADWFAGLKAGQWPLKQFTEWLKQAE